MSITPSDELIGFSENSSIADYPLLDYGGKLYDDFMNNSQILNINDNFDPNLRHCFYEYLQDILSNSSESSECPVKFDGISCWPRTSPGTLSSLPCFEEFNGIKYNTSHNATLYCREDGSWAEKSSYEMCHPIGSEESIISTGKSINLIFYIGNSMSLVAVMLALWIFLSFRDLRCLRNTIHTNLLATYLLHNLFWIASASLQSHLGVFMSCSFFVTLKYSTLTNFMWMFVEGLYLYMLVVKTFSVENIKLQIYVLIGWGAALPVIITWVAVRLQTSTEKIALAGSEDGLEGTCSLYVEDELDWIVRAPVLFVLTANILFLVRIMWVLITKLRSANTVETQRYWKATKALLVLIPLLGLTYMLLIALPQEFEHFRAVLLSTQGFWVAIFYCFLNSEVRNSIRHHIERWRTERGISHSRGASTRHFSKDSSPQSRSERFSYYGRRLFGCKRESLICSEVTTLTTFVTNGNNSQLTAAPPQPTTNYQSAVASLQVSPSQPCSSSQHSLSLYPMKEGSDAISPLSASNALLASADYQDGTIRDAIL